MGIELLLTFLKNENQVSSIDIRKEVNKWKRMHHGRKPIVLIDFLSLSYGVGDKFKDDFIYGGRHRRIQEYFKSILMKFVELGCKLIFFSDYNIQEGKIGEWLRRRNLEFKKCTALYEWIGDGKTPEEMQDMPTYYRMALKSICYEMELTAKMFGKMRYTTKNECDLEIAHYAKRNNVMAIVSCDTDYLIFDGSWKLWSSDDIEIIQLNNLTTKEYNRTAIKHICSLSQNQLPLLATLVGNDFTKAYRTTLNAFHLRLTTTYRSKNNKVKNVAHFIRQLDRTKSQNNHINKIMHDVFNSTSNEIRMLIKQSLDSYKIQSLRKNQIKDRVAQKLLNTPSYPAYMTIMSPIHGINSSYYDMRDCEEGVNLSMLQINWLKCKIGILRQRYNDDSFTFKLMAKKDLNNDFMVYEEKPIYPNFLVPPLVTLYLNNTDPNIIEFRYKILNSIMSLSDEIICKIKMLPHFSAKRVCLYALVKNGLIDVLQADAILYTEMIFSYQSPEHTEYPTKINPKHTRAAHIYNNAFTHVRQNFEIAGLLPLPQQDDIALAEMVSLFDGIYFQRLMEKITQMDQTERDELFAPLKNYRIYPDD